MQPKALSKSEAMDPPSPSVCPPTGHAHDAHVGSIVNNLPDDVLRILFSRRFLPATDLIQVASTCTAAAAIILPSLVADPVVPSLSALHDLLAVLESKPDLAQAVRKFTASEYFVLPGSFAAFPLNAQHLQNCRLDPKSLIVCMKKLSAALDSHPHALNQLPMPALARLATQCPNLCHVDLSCVPNLVRESPYLTLGLLNLTSALRARRGSIRTTPTSSLSCVLVNDHCHVPTRNLDAYKFEYAVDVHFVYAVDWAAKQIDTHNLSGMNPIVHQFCCIVPFRDLVPLSDQCSWAVRNTQLQTGVRPKPGTDEDVYLWPVTEWTQSKRMLWAKAGLEMGTDHVFDLSEVKRRGKGKSKGKGKGKGGGGGGGDSSAIQGNARLSIIYMSVAKAVASGYQLDVGRQCQELVLAGEVFPEQLLEVSSQTVASLVTQSARPFQTLRQQPFDFVRKFTISFGFFVSRTTVLPLVQAIAAGMPNLSSLDMQSTGGPIDYLAYFLDLLIRRRDGAQLQDLTLTHHVPLPTDPPTPFSRQLLAASATTWAYPDCIQNRTPLDAPSRGLSPSGRTAALKRLSLGLVGPGVPYIHAPDYTVLVIHPGLLFGLDDLTLHSVQLYMFMPAFARPDAPSLAPVEYVRHKGGNVHDAVLLTGAITLPKIRRLDVSSASLPACAGLAFAGLLPRMPNLEHLKVSVDRANSERRRVDMAQVVSVLERFPKLRFAEFKGVVGPAAERVARSTTIGERFFRPYPRELAPCPRLRYVKVNEEAPIEYFAWVKGREGRVGEGASKLESLVPTCVEN